MNNDEEKENSEAMNHLKKRIKEELKKELLEEIYKELKIEENEKLLDTSSSKVTIIETPQEKPAPIQKVKTEEQLLITVTAILKISSHSFKYANSNIPRDDWVEVIGLLAGKLDDDGTTLNIEDAYPMGHGSAIYAEIKDYKNYVRAFNDIKKKNLFICGWYHSHPSYGLFMSTEDIGTQSRYQKLWNKSVALVIDPYLINGDSYGFDIFRADLKRKKWYSVPFKIKGSISPKTLPELLKFIDPIIDGKEIFLEYDE
ncbi:MAG: hypothetical protein ACTSRG_02205 [Candidatus Helarchaeota archaeon]